MKFRDFDETFRSPAIKNTTKHKRYRPGGVYTDAMINCSRKARHIWQALTINISQAWRVIPTYECIAGSGIAGWCTRYEKKSLVGSRKKPLNHSYPVCTHSVRIRNTQSKIINHLHLDITNATKPRGDATCTKHGWKNSYRGKLSHHSKQSQSRT